MEENKKAWTLREHEKLICFIFLIISILVLVFLASSFDRGASNDIVTQGKLRIIDSSIAGLLTIAGMAAQALFKIGSGETVTIGNKPSEPVPTTEAPAPPASNAGDRTGELPEAEKL